MRQIRWVLFMGFLVLSACGGSDNNETNNQEDNSNEISHQTESTSGEDGQNNQREKDSSSSLSISSQGEFQVLNISEGIYDSTAALQINVNKPLDRSQDFNQLIHVTESGKTIQPAWIVGEQALALYYPFIETNTQYNIHVSRSLKSQQGESLTQNSVQLSDLSPGHYQLRVIDQSAQQASLNFQVAM